MDLLSPSQSSAQLGLAILAICLACVELFTLILDPACLSSSLVARSLTCMGAATSAFKLAESDSSLLLQSPTHADASAFVSRISRPRTFLPLPGFGLSGSLTSLQSLGHLDALLTFLDRVHASSAPPAHSFAQVMPSLLTFGSARSEVSLFAPDFAKAKPLSPLQSHTCVDILLVVSARTSLGSSLVLHSFSCMGSLSLVPNSAYLGAFMLLRSST